MIQLHPYNLGSKGCYALKEYLNDNGVRAIISHRRVGNLNRGRLIVGWGAKDLAFQPAPKDIIIQRPGATRKISCKKRFFELMDPEAMVPCWTADFEEAKAWLANGNEVVCRATTTGSGGDGITIVAPGGELPRVPLYTKYQKKTQEYRVHCFRYTDGIEDEWKFGHFQKKIFKKTEENPEPKDWKVRNHTQGFIFQSVDEVPELVRTACHSVLCSLDVNFVALDVIHHKPTDTAMVLEGNTAPGLEDGRLKVYGDYLIQMHGQLL